MADKEYDNNMQGVLFKNDKKSTSKHPDYTGSCEIDETEYWVSAWIKTARGSGKKFMSMAYTRKESPENLVSGDLATDLDDDIPF